MNKNKFIGKIVFIILGFFFLSSCREGESNVSQELPLYFETINYNPSPSVNTFLFIPLDDVCASCKKKAVNFAKANANLPNVVYIFVSNQEKKSKYYMKASFGEDYRRDDFVIDYSGLAFKFNIANVFPALYRMDSKGRFIKKDLSNNNILKELSQLSSVLE